MDKHDQNVQNMCRLCTGRAQTSKEIKMKKVPYMASKYTDMIYLFYGIYTTADDMNIHPQKICNSCHQLTMNAKKRGHVISKRHWANSTSKYRPITADHSQEIIVPSTSVEMF